MEKNVLIIGAGKIGRGFIAHLFFRSGYRIWFLDASKEIVDLLNKEKKYRIDLAGEAQDITEYLAIEAAYTLDQKDKLATILNGVSIVASSVGAGNIEELAAYMRESLIQSGRKKPLNWLICENATHPARKMKNVLLDTTDVSFRGFVEQQLGLVETQVLRTGMSAKNDVLRNEPLALRMQDWWTLPLDRDAFVGPMPEITGFSPRSNFSNELVRKLYTFNGTNGPIAYVGWANGYRVIHEAAQAFPAYFREIQEESAFGLIREFGIDEAEQREFMALAMKKYNDPALNDSIERNATDSKRKLGNDERLVGPALLCVKHGRSPDAYATAIAAAYYYNGSTDPGTADVQQTIQEHGIESALKKYSFIDKSSALYSMVLHAYNLKSFIF